MLRIVDANRYARDVIMLEQEDSPTLFGSQKMVVLLSPALRAGARVRAPATLGEIRARVAHGMASLPVALLDLAPRAVGARGYPVEPSSHLLSLMDRLRESLVEEGT